MFDETFENELGETCKVTARNVGDLNPEAQLQVSQTLWRNGRARYAEITIPAELVGKFVAALQTFERARK